MKVKLSKCECAVKKISYLSHIIENGTISPNPLKVSHVEDMQPPLTIKQLNGFLGYASYYRKYIRNFAKLASLLIRATVGTNKVK